MELKALARLEEVTNEGSKLLIISGYKAKSRTEKRVDYIKKGIKYELPLGKELVSYTKKEKPEHWRKWLEQTEKYLQSDKDKMLRPTIDRIDSNGNYCIDNIDFLPFYEHIQKDNAIGVTVYDFEKRSFREYPSMASVGEALGCSRETISRYCNSGVKYLNRYVIQSEGDKKSKRSKRIERVQTYDVVSDVVLNEYDEAGTIIRELPAQIHTKVEFPIIELQRNSSLIPIY
ncbi:NUMOD1 domain-containing DNA-binding protein [Psychrobacillus sp. FJAT-51614]|uniref:NUMOD1 domain-containing DNA-binding protein n=1 Tax=Psychrobacillus mangrovi TaxID=3117745 RepID=A0ABU8F7L4_9BACI